MEEQAQEKERNEQSRVLYLGRRGARSGRTGCGSPGWRASPAPPADTPTHNTATVQQPTVNRRGGSGLFSGYEIPRQDADYFLLL
jgi:hypothetical protein